jgi:hypothetical protein
LQHDGSQVFVIPEPFPMTTPRDLEKHLAQRPGVTKRVRAYYRRRQDGQLIFDRLAYEGEVPQPPVVWK